MKPFLKTTSTILVALIFSVALSYVSAWTGPAANPPSKNTPTPINIGKVGSTLQIKTGTLGLGGLISLSKSTFDFTTLMGGQLKILDGNQAEGKVLTSDANGKATWQYPVCNQSTTTPSIPSSISASPGGCTTINVSWSTSTGATSYTLRDGATVIYTDVSNQFSHTGLTGGTTHTYTVRATNSSGSSNYSSSAQATTLNNCGSGGVDTPTPTSTPATSTPPGDGGEPALTYCDKSETAFRNVINDLAKRQWFRNKDHADIVYGTGSSTATVSSANGISNIPNLDLSVIDRDRIMQNRANVITMLKQVDGEITTEYRDGNWVKDPNAVEGSATIPTYTTTDYTDVITDEGYGWFRGINMGTFDFASGTITTNIPALPNFATTSVDSSDFCSLVWFTLVEMRTTVDKLEAVRVRGAQISQYRYSNYSYYYSYSSCEDAKSGGELESGYWPLYPWDEEWVATEGVGPIETVEETRVLDQFPPLQFWEYAASTGRVRGKITANLTNFNLNETAKVYLKLSGILGNVSNEDSSPFGEEHPEKIDDKYHYWQNAVSGGVELWKSDWINNSSAMPAFSSNCSPAKVAGWKINDVMAVVQGAF
ncbi:hypothetical protein IT397_01420 [Candidatus Nomurabacteria bacterium]|nr:hypothetical protein [Candidatus Nomurabacteria bacterium]